MVNKTEMAFSALLAKNDKMTKLGLKDDSLVYQKYFLISGRNGNKYLLRTNTTFFSLHAINKKILSTLFA